MDKTLAGLIGAAGLLATSAQAATAPQAALNDAMQVQSYADLLKPIPNATELLKASDAAQATRAGSDVAGQMEITPVQWWYYRRYHHHHLHHWYYHHHHHHNDYYRHRYYHHHHHT
jgi:hypothetical protein